jgi:hypothetical protein
VVIRVISTINSTGFITITVSSVTNPISFATTGTFSALIKDHTNTVTEESTGSVPIAMNSSGTFTSFTVNAKNYSLSTPQL